MVAIANGGTTTKGGATFSGSTALGGADTTTTTSSGGSSAAGANPSTGGSGKGGSIASGGSSKGGTSNTSGAAGKSSTTAGGAAGKSSTTTGGAAGQGNAATGGTAGKSSTTTGGTATGGTSSTAAAGSSASPNCAGSGWTLTWSDEFNGPAGTGVDPKNWTFDLGSQNGGWGNNELEYYTNEPDNVAMDGNGNLAITARQESEGGKDYTSARIRTQGLRTFKYGRIEGRMRIPKGQGIWPAFWMLGTDIGSNAWPNCGEIDIMENVGKEPNIVHGSLHGPGYSGGNPLTGQVSLSEPVSNAFHLFAIEWDATSIRWYVDDKLYSTKTSSDVPTGATWVYTHEFFIILNVAVGGTWPGSPNTSTTFPQAMLVDYVRACQK